MTESDHRSPGSKEPLPAPDSLIDAIADLLQLSVNWLRQQAGALVRDKVITPLQRLGLTVTSSAAAGCLAVLGLSFLSVALLLLLADWFGWIGALALIGGILLIGSLVFTAIKIRSMQR